MNETEDLGWEVTGRSGNLGCNDITSVFAFLAFLFALLNFVVNMGGQGRRRRRSEDSECQLDDHTKDSTYRDSVRSVSALYRGVLTYLQLQEAGETEEDCGARVLCQAGREAAGGELGGVIAVLGAHRAGWLLQSLGHSSHRETVRAVTEGVVGRDCELLHHCGLSSTSSSHSEAPDRGRLQLSRMRGILRDHISY